MTYVSFVGHQIDIQYLSSSFINKQIMYLVKIKDLKKGNVILNMGVVESVIDFEEVNTIRFSSGIAVDLEYDFIDSEATLICESPELNEAHQLRCYAHLSNLVESYLKVSFHASESLYRPTRDCDSPIERFMINEFNSLLRSNLFASARFSHFKRASEKFRK